MSKVCTKCDLELPFSEYHRDHRKKSGLRAVCKGCCNKAGRKRYKANPEQGRETIRKWRQANPGRAKEINRKWRQANPEQAREACRRYLSENPEKARKSDRESCRRYYAKNRGKRKANYQKWAAANPGRVKAHKAKRRAAKKQAMPGWLTESQINEIKQIYIDCPKGFHVDHEVPLQGATVSGLHVPWNLKSIPASENLRKGNKLEV